MTGRLFKKLQDVLTAAFDPKGMLQFATVSLAFEKVQFANVVNFNQSGKDVAFDLVRAVEMHGYVKDMVLALCQKRDKRDDVLALAAELGLDGPHWSSSPDLEEWFVAKRGRPDWAPWLENASSRLAKAEEFFKTKTRLPSLLAARLTGTAPLDFAGGLKMALYQMESRVREWGPVCNFLLQLALEADEIAKIGPPIADDLRSVAEAMVQGFREAGAPTFEERLENQKRIPRLGRAQIVADFCPLLESIGAPRDEQKLVLNLWLWRDGKWAPNQRWQVEKARTWSDWRRDLDGVLNDYQDRTQSATQATRAADEVPLEVFWDLQAWGLGPERPDLWRSQEGGRPLGAIRPVALRCRSRARARADKEDERIKRWRRLWGIPVSHHSNCHVVSNKGHFVFLSPCKSPTVMAPEPGGLSPQDFDAMVVRAAAGGASRLFAWRDRPCPSGKGLQELDAVAHDEWPYKATSWREDHIDTDDMPSLFVLWDDPERVPPIPLPQVASQHGTDPS